MKKFKVLTLSVCVLLFFVIIIVNFFLLNSREKPNGEYRVEIERAVTSIENNKDLCIDDYKYIKNIAVSKLPDESFFRSDNEYAVRKINDLYYRFDYEIISGVNNATIIVVNIVIIAFAVFVAGILIYIERNVISPFNRISDIPYELSKGNLIMPLKENKSRYFGKFIWGLELLRDKLEQQKEEELKLQKERKTLVLSLSHDIKTPLSAIKLSSKALVKGLYPEIEKQKKVAENINSNADKIESYVCEIIKNSKDDFLNFDVNNSEFYLSECINRIENYYKDKLSINKTEFIISDYTDCIMYGDVERSIEVIQNIIENAIKYGDGSFIKIDFCTEENCRLIKISNSGSTLSEGEMPHIFESFWRGSNSDNVNGSGLGLYICRQLMILMNGEVYAEQKENIFSVTLVFRMA